MTEAYAAINGNRLTKVKLVMSAIGPWHAEVEFEGAPEISGLVTMTIGNMSWKGTLKNAATFGLQMKARIVAGAGGWGESVVKKGYHNDAGVKARTVAEDAARAVGETIGMFTPVKERIGLDYVREATTASCALEDVIGETSWWVDALGVTNVGPRPTVELSNESYEVLAFDPKSQTATLAVDDPSIINIGSIISERLDIPRVIREFELNVDETEMRIIAWCGSDALGQGRLQGLFRSIIDRTTDNKLFGKYKYRVLRMNGDRAELQVVSASLGLPDLIPVSMWPGIAGTHSELAPSQEVLVEFIGGSRTEPIITAYAGKDGKGFIPAYIILGGSSGSEVTRKGDAVEVLLPPMVVNGTMVVSGTPTPFTGVLTSTLGKAIGAATAGSSKVKAAS